MSQSRNMIAWFIKTYLHKPIKIQQFFSSGKIQKLLTYLRNILPFSTIFISKLSRTYNKRFFTLYSCLYHSSMIISNMIIPPLNELKSPLDKFEKAWSWLVMPNNTQPTVVALDDLFGNYFLSENIVFFFPKLLMIKEFWNWLHENTFWVIL